ncbi:facilitated trehalose transporter Tret1-like isoform X1 [Diabrotica virgifera virgifera]|uniref:Major facilitator superfamily (MFS) profile domain-containing protein n=2 Tax=Diabrotica virgifera virgifera TaxID=50390 RepID=A0ABM5K456_DIAVI|nr:facilitated trehalose transporter Tret1-like isoform X1 [Diabrotica virgifera virgifera]
MDIIYEKIDNKINIKNFTQTFKNREVNWRIYVSTLTANLLLISGGSMVAWTSPVINRLKSNSTEENPLGSPITTMEISILAAIPQIATLFSFIPMAKLSQAFGRKKLMLYGAVCLLVTQIVISFARNIYMYYVCLLSVGLGLSAISISVPIYCGEVADTSNRGIIGCFLGTSMVFGMLLMYVFGSFLSIKMFTLICAFPTLVHIILHMFVIESPIYLISKGKKIEAIRTLESLRGNRSNREIETEYLSLQQSVESDLKRKNLSMLDLFKIRSGVKAFFISITLCIGQQGSGISIIVAFLGPIFNESGANISGDNVGIIVGSAQVITYAVAAYVIEKLGRRSLLLFSSLGCSLFMLSMGISFYLKHINSSFIADIRWLPVLFVILYVICYGFGLGPIPVCIIGELFPHDFRSIGTALVLVFDSILMAIINFSFPLLSEAFGTFSCMIAHSSVSLLAFIVLYLLLPETKGKTLNEIQDLLNK